MAKQLLSQNNCVFVCPELAGKISHQCADTVQKIYNTPYGNELTETTKLSGIGICTILTTAANGVPQNCTLKNASSWLLLGKELSIKFNGKSMLNEYAMQCCPVGSMITAKVVGISGISVPDYSPAIAKAVVSGWANQTYLNDNTVQSSDEIGIYADAGLTPKVVDGKPCLCKEIDTGFTDPISGETNLKKMIAGKSPIDPATGEKIELHHMGQIFDSPLVELLADTEHGGENYAKLHSAKESCRDEETASKYQKEKSAHWKERASEYKH